MASELIRSQAKSLQGPASMNPMSVNPMSVNPSSVKSIDNDPKSVDNSSTSPEKQPSKSLSTQEQFAVTLNAFYAVCDQVEMQFVCLFNLIICRQSNYLMSKFVRMCITIWRF